MTCTPPILIPPSRRRAGQPQQKADQQAHAFRCCINSTEAQHPQGPPARPTANEGAESSDRLADRDCWQQCDENCGEHNYERDDQQPPQGITDHRCRTPLLATA
jgi:hypothetical protein